MRHAKLGIVCSTIPLCKVGAEITGEATRVVREAVQRAEVHNEVFEGAALNASTTCTPGDGVRIGIWVDKRSIPSKAMRIVSHGRILKDTIGRNVKVPIPVADYVGTLDKIEPHKPAEETLRLCSRVATFIPKSCLESCNVVTMPGEKLALIIVGRVSSCLL